VCVRERECVWCVEGELSERVVLFGVCVCVCVLVAIENGLFEFLLQFPHYRLPLHLIPKEKYQRWKLASPKKNTKSTQNKIHHQSPSRHHLDLNSTSSIIDFSAYAVCLFKVFHQSCIQLENSEATKTRIGDI